MEYKQYRRRATAELRPYIEEVDGKILNEISLSDEDARSGSPRNGDMIARNPKNHTDKWLIAKRYFEDNFEEML